MGQGSAAAAGAPRSGRQPRGLTGWSESQFSAAAVVSVEDGRPSGNREERCELLVLPGMRKARGAYRRQGISTNPELTAFEALGKDDLHVDTASTETR